MSGNYSVRYEVEKGVPVLYIAGDMTSDADNSVMKAYTAIKERYGASRIIFNFAETNYINSAGLATIINIIQEMGNMNGKVAFSQLNHHFRKVMDIVGITDFVTIYENNSDAADGLVQ